MLGHTLSSGGSSGLMLEGGRAGPELRCVLVHECCGGLLRKSAGYGIAYGCGIAGDPLHLREHPGCGVAGLGPLGDHLQAAAVQVGRQREGGVRREGGGCAVAADEQREPCQVQAASVLAGPAAAP